MKKKIVKMMLSFVVAASLMISNAGIVSASGENAANSADAQSEELPESEMALEKLDTKIVPAKTLGMVNGFQYDPSKQYIYWNKVSGANSYSISIKGGDYQRNTNLYHTYFNLSNLNDGVYTVNLTAKNTDECYLYASNVTSSEMWSKYSDFDSYVYANADRTRYNLYKNVVGATATFQFTVSSVGKSTTSITKLSGIAQKRITENEFIFGVTNTSTPINSGETIHWEYSNNPKFSSRAKGEVLYTTTTEDIKDTISIKRSRFLPEEICYVRARVSNSSYTGGNNKYGDYTNVATYKLPKAEIASVQTNVSGTSITITTGLKLGRATGYEYSKKIGSKWVSLGIYSSQSYKDSGLSKKQRYQYRVRAYIYDKNTKKTTWTSWKYADAMAWGNTLNLTAEAASSTSAKLKWNKVSDAEGYEIYRIDTDSIGDTRQAGNSIDGFDNYSLIKTIKKASTKTYTDKKLKSGKTYSYFVRAYCTVNKQKCYIQEQVTVELKAGVMSITEQYYTSSGAYKVNWKKMTGVKGYYIEQYNYSTDDYTVVKTLKGSANSYTFGRVAANMPSIRYRITPYDTSVAYSGSIFDVEPKLAVVKNIKAKKTSDGIQISWSKVPGADYYRVYRTTNSRSVYDKTTKSYLYSGSDIENVTEAVINTTNCSPELGGREYNAAGTYKTTDITGNSIVDKTVTYKITATDENGNYIEVGKNGEGDKVYQTEEKVFNEGPEVGVTYYYYVVACADAASGKERNTVVHSVGSSKSASATYTNKAAKKVSKITSASSTAKRTATIKYKKVSGVSGYAIYRSTSKNGTYVLVGTTTKTSFKDSGLVSGKKYYYKVASYVKSESKSNVYSAKTAAKQVKIK